MKSLTLVLSILLLGITSALAGQPVRDTIIKDRVSGTYETCPEVGEMFPVDCGNGLLICETGETEVNYRLTVNDNYEYVRYWAHANFAFVLWELGNPDNFLQSKPGAGTAYWDFVEGTHTETGNGAMITIPGYGQIFRDVGRIIGSANLAGMLPPFIFAAGEHQYIEGDYEAVCNYLAGN